MKSLKVLTLVVYFLFPVCFCISLHSKVIAQTRPSTCEEARHAFDESISSWLRSKERFVIFVFHKGMDETAQDIIDKRMKSVVAHINFRGVDDRHFVMAEGKKRNGLGKLDIYVEGQIALELYAAQNAEIGADCRSKQ